MYSSRYQRWGSIKENKKVRKPRTRPRKRLIKKEKLAFFLDQITFLVEFLFSYFLVFFYKFPPQDFNSGQFQGSFLKDPWTVLDLKCFIKSRGDSSR